MVKAQGGEWLVGLALWGVTPRRPMAHDLQVQEFRTSCTEPAKVQI